MKGIKIDNRLLLREESKQVMRDKNTLNMGFSIEPIIGEVFSKTSLSEANYVKLNIQKEEELDIWNALKDVDNETIITFIFSICNEWKSVSSAVAPLTIYDTINDPEKGETQVVNGNEEPTEEYIKKRELEVLYQSFESLFSLIEKYNFEVIEI